MSKRSDSPALTLSHETLEDISEKLELVRGNLYIIEDAVVRLSDLGICLPQGDCYQMSLIRMFGQTQDDLMAISKHMQGGEHE